MGQADLSPVLDEADRGAQTLATFAAQFRQIGAPIAAEIAQLVPQIERKFGSVEDAPESDPLVQRADRLSFASQIHLPDLEGIPRGTFPIELDPFDLQDLRTGKAAIIAAISAVRGESAASVQKRLIDRNANPTFAARTPALAEAVRIENLLQIYREDVLGRARLRGVSPLAIVGGITIGLLALAGIAYAARRRK